MSEIVSTPKAVMAILRAADRPLTTREIYARGEFDNTTKVSVAVHDLRRAGRLTTEVRGGERYHCPVDGSAPNSPAPQQPSPRKKAPQACHTPAALTCPVQKTTDPLEALASSAAAAVDAYLAGLGDPVLRHLLAARDAARQALAARNAGAA